MDQDDLVVAWCVPSRIQAGAQTWSLGHRRLWEDPLSMMFALDARSTNDSIREGLECSGIRKGLKDHQIG